jgi:hypothetical protein
MDERMHELADEISDFGAVTDDAGLDTAACIAYHLGALLPLLDGITSDRDREEAVSQVAAILDDLQEGMK